MTKLRSSRTKASSGGEEHGRLQAPYRETPKEQRTEPRGVTPDTLRSASILQTLTPMRLSQYRAGFTP